MWPVQTLTLLLCLTDDEQLYAQALPQVEEVPAVEAPAVEEHPDPKTVLLIEDWA